MAQNMSSFSARKKRSVSAFKCLHIAGAGETESENGSTDDTYRYVALRAKSGVFVHIPGNHSSCW